MGAVAGLVSSEKAVSAHVDIATQGRPLPTWSMGALEKARDDRRMMQQADWRRSGKSEISGVQRGALRVRGSRSPPVCRAHGPLSTKRPALRCLILSACQNFAHIRSVRPLRKAPLHSPLTFWAIPILSLLCVCCQTHRESREPLFSLLCTL